MGVTVGTIFSSSPRTSNAATSPVMIDAPRAVRMVSMAATGFAGVEVEATFVELVDIAMIDPDVLTEEVVMIGTELNVMLEGVEDFVDVLTEVCRPAMDALVEELDVRADDDVDFLIEELVVWTAANEVDDLLEEPDDDREIVEVLLEIIDVDTVRSTALMEDFAG